MSRINGEKARAAIARKRRTAQRVKDRVGRQDLLAAALNPVEAKKPVKKTIKKAAAVEPKKADTVEPKKAAVAEPKQAAPAAPARPAKRARPAPENA